MNKVMFNESLLELQANLGLSISSQQTVRLVRQALCRYTGIAKVGCNRIYHRDNDYFRLRYP